MDIALPKLQSRSSLTEEVFDILRTLILQAKLKPGERITESAVASQTGVSVTPVREAFLKLEAAGLIVSRPRQPSQVAMLSLDELEQYVFIRSTLEQACLDRIIERIDEDEVSALKALVTQMRESLEQRDWETYAKTHYRLHQRLLQAGQWPIVDRLVMGIFDNLDRYRFIGDARSLTFWCEDQGGHEDLVRAIEEKDRQTARRIMLESQNRLVAHLTQAVARGDEGIAIYFTDSPKRPA
jgi:DNA-binding GntR family transcriptional regulator